MTSKNSDVQALHVSETASSSHGEASPSTPKVAGNASCNRGNLFSFRFIFDPKDKNTDTDELANTSEDPCLHSSFSIPITSLSSHGDSRKKSLNDRSKSERSVARQFLDLTKEMPSTQRNSTKRGSSGSVELSSSTSFSCDDDDQCCETTVILDDLEVEETSNYLESNPTWDSCSSDEDSIRDESNSLASLAATLASKSATLSGYDSETIHSRDSRNCSIFYTGEEYERLYGGWEKANAILVQEAHEISGLLQGKLMERGLESPYWKASEIIPEFQNLHHEMKTDMRSHMVQLPRDVSKHDSSSRGIIQMGEPLASEIDMAVAQLEEDNNSSERLERKGVTPNPASIQLKSCTEFQSSDSSLDLAALFDHREEHEFDPDYLTGVLYKLTKKTTVVPPIIAAGLEKSLSTDTIDTAVGILGELTSPLHSWRFSSSQIDSIIEENRQSIN